MKLLLQTRKNFIKLIESHSLEQLNTIPAGYKNNLIWNFGHVLVTQQLLCYKLSGLAMKLEDEIIAKYKKGTAPSGEVDADELERLKYFALSSIDNLQNDLKAKRFEYFESYETSYGFTLENIEDAMDFNLVHESMHLGYAMAMRKAFA